MSIEVTMPQMGADMTEGVVVRWVKQVGDQVARGDVIAEIETDKATVELEAFEAGVLLKQVVAEGETVPVGEVIALLGGAGEVAPEVQRLPPASTPATRTISPEARATVASPATPAPTAAMADGRLRISPVAKRIAMSAGIDPAAITGSGPDGRILRRDVEAAIAAGRAVPPAISGQPAAAAAVPAPAREPVRPAAATGPVEALTKVRQTIARRMTQSKQTQPHYYLTVDVDMTAALAFREQLNRAADETERVSINDLIVKACALALLRHPKFNAEFSDEGIRYHERVNIDIGIALDEGLSAPALLDCGGKTLGTIAREAKDLITRAKTGHIHTDEYGSGTFTITNLGAYGVESLIGIINPPQAAILGVGSVLAKPVVHEGEIAVRQVMKVALSADHRVTDGAEGARFIKEIQGLLENPASLAL